jgi:hypothetical protein
MPLRAREHNKNSLEASNEALDVASSTALPAGSKGHGTIEKEIETAWHEFAKLGWSFNGFAAAMLEVLTVLYKQDRLKAGKAKHEVKGFKSQP